MIIIGWCSKPVWNHVENAEDYKDAAIKNDVVSLLKVIKNIAFDSNEKKYPPMQAGQAWKQLCLARQQENEDLVDYYKRFVSLIEMVELIRGKIFRMSPAPRSYHQEINGNLFLIFGIYFKNNPCNCTKPSKVDGKCPLK